MHLTLFFSTIQCQFRILILLANTNSIEQLLCIEKPVLNTGLTIFYEQIYIIIRFVLKKKISTHLNSKNSPQTKQIFYLKYIIKTNQMINIHFVTLIFDPIKCYKRRCSNTVCIYNEFNSVVNSSTAQVLCNFLYKSISVLEN